MRYLGIGLIVVAIILSGGLIASLNPAPPEIREKFTAETAPIDDRTGVYQDAAGELWLVAPGLAGGFTHTPVDHWGRVQNHFE